MKNFNAVFLLLLYAFSFVVGIQSMDNQKMDIALKDLCTQEKMDEVVQVLKEKPEEIDKTDFMGRSFLVWAVLTKNVKVTKFLVTECSRLLLLPDLTMRTPLHYAATAGDENLCKALLLSSYSLVCQEHEIKDVGNKALTMLLINKYCKKSFEKKLPRMVLVNCILKPLLLREEKIKKHKECIEKMLSSEDRSGHKSFEYASGANDFKLRSLLDPKNIDELYKAVELLY